MFFQTKCLEFYIELTKQIYTRFPFNSNEMKILKEMSFLDPKNVGNVESLGPISQHFNHLIPDVNSLDRDWRMFKSKELSVPYSKGQAINDFWISNLSVTKGDDELLFPMLNEFFSYLFVLPHSSACVERVFSCISLNKTNK